VAVFTRRDHTGNMCGHRTSRTAAEPKPVQHPLGIPPGTGSFIEYTCGVITSRQLHERQKLCNTSEIPVERFRWTATTRIEEHGS